MQHEFFKLPGDTVSLGRRVGPSAFFPFSSKVGCPQSRTLGLRGFISRTHRATASCPVVHPSTAVPSSASSIPEPASMAVVCTAGRWDQAYLADQLLLD